MEERKHGVVDFNKLTAADNPHRRFMNGKALAQYQTTNQYLMRLNKWLRSIKWIKDESYALNSDWDAWERCRNDAVCAFAIRYRRLLVAGRKYHIEARQDVYKPFVPVFEELFERCDSFTRDRFAATQFIFTGLCAQRMSGQIDYDVIADTGQHLRWQYVKEFKHVDKRRLRMEWEIIPNPDGTPGPRRYYWTAYDFETWSWYEIPKPDWWVFFVTDDDEDALGLGRGRLDEIYYYWFLKTHFLKYAAQYAERFAEPWITAQLEGLKSYQDDFSSLVNQYIAALQKMRGNRVLVYDKQDEVGLADAPSSAQSIILDVIRYLDEGIIRACLGGLDNTGSSQGGGDSKAKAEVHETATELNANFDRTVMEEAYTQKALRGMWLWNRRSLAALGFVQNLPLRCPLKFKLDQATKINPVERAQVFKAALEMGVRPTTTDIANDLDIVEADEDETNIATLQQPGAQAGLVDPMGQPLEQDADLTVPSEKELIDTASARFGAPFFV